MESKHNQCQIDHDRLLKIQRDEIRARLEVKYMKIENEFYTKNYYNIKTQRIEQIEK
jgi:ribosome-associated toxin RatA of RatAB toxin-antitoxin module